MIEKEGSDRTYLRETIHVLHTCLHLAWEEYPAFYRPVAVQLRILLCDTNRQHDELVDISLAPRVWEDLSLPALGARGADSTLPPLPLDQWLEQPLNALQPPLTIRQLIRRVCDQDGGAHVDLKSQAGLPENPEYRDWVLRIGGIVYRALEKRLHDESRRTFSGDCFD